MKVHNILIGLLAIGAGPASAFIRSGPSGNELPSLVLRNAHGQQSGTPIKTTKNSAEQLASGSVARTVVNLTGGGLLKKPIGRESTESNTQTADLSNTAREKAAITKKRLAAYVSTWYLSSVAFNIINANVIPALDLPLSVTAAYNIVGNAIAVPILGLRLLRAHRTPAAPLRGLALVTICQALSATSFQACLQGGGVNCLLLAKAVEPLATAVFSDLTSRKNTSSALTYARLLPIAVGLGLPPATMLKNIDWSTFGTSMASMLASACSTVFAKRILMGNAHAVGESDGRKVASPTAVNAALTIMSGMLLVPLAWMLEGLKVESLLLMTTTTPDIGRLLVLNAVCGGLTLYLGNEMLCRILQVLSPVAASITANMSVYFVNAVFAIAHKVNLSPAVSIVGTAAATAGVGLFSNASTVNASEATSTATRTAPAQPPVDKGNSKTSASSNDDREGTPQGERAAGEKVKVPSWMRWRRPSRGSDGVSSKGGPGANGGRPRRLF